MTRKHVAITLVFSYDERLDAQFAEGRTEGSPVVFPTPGDLIQQAVEGSLDLLTEDLQRFGVFLPSDLTEDEENDFDDIITTHEATNVEIIEKWPPHTM